MKKIYESGKYLYYSFPQSEDSIVTFTFELSYIVIMQFQLNLDNFYNSNLDIYPLNITFIVFIA